MDQLGVLKTSLFKGEQAGGCWIEMFSPLAAEIVGQAGYDCAIIDMEHGPGSLMDAIAVMQALKATGCSPLIRTPANDPVHIKRALDIGPAGLMIPGVDGLEDAKRAIEACRYPPEGWRGLAPTIVRASDYGAEAEAYFERANAELLTICQVETAQTLAEIEKIAALPGLDLLFVGPNDLAAALGVAGELDHPKVGAALDRVREAAKACGKLSGTIPIPSQPAETLFNAGYDMVIAASDTGLLRDAARRSAASLKAAARTRQA